ncbi:MAG: ATP-binding protein [Candidatus Brockarchaeota archaeon]|nr:ATP-binding protein [Candidatus Brockarchaeota archaeon]
MDQKIDPIYFVFLIVLLISMLKHIAAALPFSFNNYFPAVLPTVFSLITIIIVFLLKRSKSIKSILPINDEKYFIVKTDSSELIIGGVSISPEESSELRSIKADDYYRRVQSFISGILKSGVSLTCVTHISPVEAFEDSAHLTQLLIVSRKIGREGINEAIKMLETDIEKMRSIYNTAFPELKIVRLSGEKLIKYLNSILIDKSVLGKSKVRDLANSLALHVPGYTSLLPSNSYIEHEGGKETIDLGSVIFSGSKIAPLKLKINMFEKHVAIYGSTGSGKTTTAKHIVRELARLGYSLMILDWHNEYRHLAEELNGRILGLGSFALDIINPIESSNVSEHVAMVTDIFDQIYNFTPSQSYMFREVLLQTLTENMLGIKAYDPLVSFIDTLEKWSIKSFYENETKFALLRRLRPLVTGQNREIFCNRDKLISIRDILEGITVFELGDIIEVDMRKLTSLFILALLYEFRLKNRDSKRHFIVLEEAHNILPYRRRDSPQTIAEKLFLEMRKFNESLILISQFPSQISPEIVKSTGLKISHRICEGEESRILMDIMGLSQEDYDLLKRLPPGYGFLTAEGISKPIFLSIYFNEK